MGREDPGGIAQDPARLHVRGTSDRGLREGATKGEEAVGARSVKCVSAARNLLWQSRLRSIWGTRLLLLSKFVNEFDASEGEWGFSSRILYVA